MRHKRAYLWGLITRIGPSAIQLIATMVLARYLSPSDFGTVGVLAIIFAVANVLVDSGLGGSLINEKEISKLDCSTISTFNIVSGVAIYAVIWFLADAVEEFYSIAQLSKILRILGLLFLISPFGIVPKTLLYRSLRFKQICIISIVSVAAAATIAIFAAMAGVGVYSLVLLQLSNALIGTSLYMYAARYLPTFRFSLQSFRRMVSFGVYTTITSVIDTMYENLLTSLTGKYLDIRYAGYVSQAKRIEEVLSTSLANTIGNITFPILARLKNDRDTFVKEANSIFKSMVVGLTPVLLSISLFSTPIVNLLFGREWEPAGVYLKLLIFAGIVMIMETTIRSFVKSFNHVGKLMKLTILKRIIGILVMLACLQISPTYVIYGYIVSTLVAFLLNSILYCFVTKQSLIAFLANVFSYIIPSLAVWALNIGLQWMLGYNLLLQIIVVVLLLAVYYLIALPCYHIVSLESLRNFRNNKSENACIH